MRSRSRFQQGAELSDDRGPDAVAELVDFGMDRGGVIPGPDNVPPLAVGAKEGCQPGEDRVAGGLSPVVGQRRDRGAVDRACGLLGERKQDVAFVVEVGVEGSVTGARLGNDVGYAGRGEAEVGEGLARGRQESLAGRSVRGLSRSSRRLIGGGARRGACLSSR